MVDIQTNDETLALINTYGPNTDDPGFFKKVLDHILDFSCDNIILGGDVNLVLDVAIDRKEGNVTTTQNL